MRLLTRVILVISFIMATIAVIFALYSLGISDPTSWAVVAAALAVVTSIISSWIAQRGFELELDSEKPYPYPIIDITSRFGIMQLKVKNFGGSVARNISIRWDKPLVNSKEEPIVFTKNNEFPDIPVLMPGDSISVKIDLSLHLFKKFEDINYTGKIYFEDASGKKKSHNFFLSIEQYRETLSFSEEEPKTHHELQKLPDEISKLSNKLDLIIRALDKY